MKYGLRSKDARMTCMPFRSLRLLLAATALLALLGCSKDDAQALRASAAALRAAATTAFAQYAELNVRRQYGVVTEETDLKAYYEQKKGILAGTPTTAQLETALEVDRKDRTKADRIRKTYAAELATVSFALALLEQSTQKYADAWPLGTGDILCLKAPIQTIAQGFRMLAVSMNGAASPKGIGSRYQRFNFEAAPIHRELRAAVAAGNDIAGMAASTRLDRLLGAESAENAKVQAKFVQLAELASEINAQLDRAGTVSAGDALGILSRGLGQLSKIDTGFDSASAKASVDEAIQRAGDDKWLGHLAAGTVYVVPANCTTP